MLTRRGWLCSVCRAHARQRVTPAHAKVRKACSSLRAVHKCGVKTLLLTQDRGLPLAHAKVCDTYSSQCAVRWRGVKNSRSRKAKTEGYTLPMQRCAIRILASALCVGTGQNPSSLRKAKTEGCLQPMQRCARRIQVSALCASTVYKLSLNNQGANYAKSWFFRCGHYT